MRYSINEGIRHYKKNTKRIITSAIVGASSLGLMLAVPLGAHASGCTTVSTSKGTLTAAQVGGNVSGDLDATGCDIGAYFNGANPGSVNRATVHDANQYGVFVDSNAGDATVNVTDSTITKIGNHSGGTFAPNGGQTGVGVYYAGLNNSGLVSGTVKGNDVNQYQKGGIVTNGGEASSNVMNNKVTGLSNVPYIAQNGIQFGYGGGGQAKGNTVDGNWYTGANWASTGILVFESSGVNVDSNTVTNSQVGVDAESWCYFGVQSANNNKFIGNDVSGADYGAVVAAYSLYSDCDAQANNNKVTNNSFSGSGSAGSEGIFVGTAVYTGSYSPQASNNKVIHDKVSGFETAADTSGDATAKVHANSFQ